MVIFTHEIICETLHKINIPLIEDMHLCQSFNSEHYELFLLQVLSTPSQITFLLFLFLLQVSVSNNSDSVDPFLWVPTID